MSKLAPKLTVAMRAAMLICAASFAVPTANAQDSSAEDETSVATPDAVLVDQVVTADVTAHDDQDLVYAEYITSTVLAQANSSVGIVVNDTYVAGHQDIDASTVSAVSSVSAEGIWSYPITNATAQGNGLTVGTTSPANVSVDLLQEGDSGTRVTALSELRITDYMAHSVQGVSANTNGVQISGEGHHYGDIRQYANGDTRAEGLIAAETAEIETAEMAVAATGNSILAGGDDTSMTLIANQVQEGTVEAVADVSVNNLDYGGTIGSQATGNTINSSTSYGDGDSQSGQFNTGEVRSTTTLNLGDFTNGVVNGSAQAMGNSSLVSAIGASANSNAVQNNTAAVTATATLAGGVGGTGTTAAGANMAATAMGNSSSTYVCSECANSLGSTPTQTNSGAVTAYSGLSHTGSIHSTSATATAVGNAATFSSQNPY